jgi:hypothetical protein
VPVRLTPARSSRTPIPMRHSNNTKIMLGRSCGSSTADAWPPSNELQDADLTKISAVLACIATGFSLLYCSRQRAGGSPLRPSVFGEVVRSAGLQVPPNQTLRAERAVGWVRAGLDQVAGAS